MNNKINWYVHIIDVVVVIVGVTIAFALNNWQESSKENKIRNEYLLSLQNDLEKDQFELQQYLDTSYHYLAATNSLIRSIFTNDMSNDSSLLQGVISLYVHFAFSPQDGTYNSMVASGHLRYLTDFEIQRSIIDLYESDYDDLMAVDDFIRQHNFGYKVPFFNDNLKYGRGGIENKDVLLTSKMQNIAFSSQYFWQEKIELYKNALEKNNRLDSLIIEKLKI